MDSGWIKKHFFQIAFFIFLKKYILNATAYWSIGYMIIKIWKIFRMKISHFLAFIPLSEILQGGIVDYVRLVSQTRCPIQMSKFSLPTSLVGLARLYASTSFSCCAYIQAIFHCLYIMKRQHKCVSESSLDREVTDRQRSWKESPSGDDGRANFPRQGKLARVYRALFI